MNIFRFLILALCLLVLFACAEKKVVPVEPDTTRLETMAAQAWQKGDFARSQIFYEQLLREVELDRKEAIKAWQRLAFSAFKNSDYLMAMQALNSWAELEPAALDKWRWHEIYALSLNKTKDEQAYVLYLENLYLDSKTPFPLARKAALELALTHFKSKRYPEAASVLKGLYSRARTDEQRSGLERDYLELFLDLGPDLKQAEAHMNRRKQLDFPYNIFWWAVHQQYLEEDPARWPAIHPLLLEIAGQGRLVDRDFWFGLLEYWEKELGKPSTRIALALPLSGDFSTAGWKILRGAGQAHLDMVSRGMEIEIKTINTDDPEWLKRLARMDDISLVGGPLSGRQWREVLDSGLHEEFVFMTFMPSLDNEGILGWRFFPSARDQVRVLLDQAVNQMGITDFAVLYPEEDFGRAYAETFWDQARNMGAEIRNIKSYPPDDQARWNDIVSSFLKTGEWQDQAGGYPDFQAVFIPDTLSRAQGLLPQFFYFNQDQLLFLGPMLWYQAYSPNTLEQQFFSLALTSGPWCTIEPSEPSARLVSGLEKTLQGEADFWVALGYDFARFASRNGDPPSAHEPEEVNRFLQNNSFYDWSMAPITWDELGRASQDLFVFQMDRTSLVPANPYKLNWLMEFRKQRKEMWMERIREQQLQEELNF